ncbi:MAG: amino acid adenylation domain-containing protein [Spirochaetales bacterium]|nr:amino acid adenylation domain-containing protein [Spirochaetales bacterium]
MNAEMTRNGYTLQDLFVEQVKKTPRTTALVGGGEKLTYEELNRYSNRVAQALIDLEPSSPFIPLYMDRSIYTIVTLLGILKAGFAYIPLDRKLPPERVKSIMAEAGARLMVSDEKNSPFPGVANLCLHHILSRQDLSSEEPNRKVKPDATAYIIFTSGSTGTPKGVMISHRALVSYLQSVREKLNLPSSARYAHISTLNADLGHTMLFPSLLSGSTLHLLEEDLFLNANAFCAYMNDNKIDCLKITPSHFSALLNGSEPQKAVPRQRLIFGGEGLPWELVDRVRGLSTDVKIYNHYGPTEATVGVLAWEVDRKIEGTGFVPLGYPLSGMETYLMDGDRLVTETDAPGELYLSGVCLSSGYLNREDLTGDRFIPNPFRQDAPYDRMYRTGDLVKRLPQGNMEFLGRTDFQVKIRGNRVEPDEIRRVMEDFPSLDRAVVLAENNQLFGFYTGVSPLPAHRIKTFLHDKLPPYMVPAALLQVESIPLNGNGKIDRKALLSLREADREKGSFPAPERESEKRIASLFYRVLKTKPTTVGDDFFRLGGDSLSAIRLTALLEKEFGRTFSMMELFENPTIEGISRLISADKKENSGENWALHSLKPEGNKTPFFFIGSTGHGQLLADQLEEDRPVYGLNIFGINRLYREKLRTFTVQDIAREFMGEIVKVQPRGPYLLGAYCADTKIAIEIVRLLLEQGEEVPLLAFFDIPSAFGTYSAECSPRSLGRKVKEKFQSLGPDYLLLFLSRRWGEWQRKIKLCHGELQIRSHRRQGKELPLPLRDSAIVRRYLEAVSEYELVKLPVDIVAFRSREWAHRPIDILAENMGEIRTRIIPGSHEDLFLKKESLSVLAGNMRTELNKYEENLIDL